MAGEDAVIKVRVDTTQAKADLRALGRDMDGAGRSVGRGVGRAGVGRAAAAAGSRFGLGALGLGAAGIIGGAGAVVGGLALGGAVAAGGAGIARGVGHSMQPLMEKFDTLLFGQSGPNIRGADRALQETVSAFGPAIGAGGASVADARQFFDQVSELRTQEERGAKELREALGGSADQSGGLLGGLMKRLDQLIDLVADGVEWLKSWNPF